MSEREGIIKNLTDQQRKMLVDRLAEYLYEKEKEEKRIQEISKL